MPYSVMTKNTEMLVNKFSVEFSNEDIIFSAFVDTLCKYNAWTRDLYGSEFLLASIILHLHEDRHLDLPPLINMSTIKL